MLLLRNKWYLSPTECVVAFNTWGLDGDADTLGKIFPFIACKLLALLVSRQDIRAKSSRKPSKSWKSFRCWERMLHWNFVSQHTLLAWRRCKKSVRRIGFSLAHTCRPGLLQIGVSLSRSRIRIHPFWKCNHLVRVGMKEMPVNAP